MCTLLLASGAAAASDNGSVRVITPRAGETIVGSASYEAQLPARTLRRTIRVEVWLGNRRVATDRSRPYSGTFDSTKFSDGDYEFKLRAILRSSKGASTARAHIFSRMLRVKVANKKKLPSTPTPTAPTTTAPAPTTPAPTPGVPSTEIAAIKSSNSDWNKKFEDNFDGNALDRTKWLDERDDWIKGMIPYNNQEGAWYSKSLNTVGNGSLTQTIRKIPSNGAPYTTGSINSNKKFNFKYGYVEARIKVPACSGCWPAFWMLPTTPGWPPEIDIFEFFSSLNDGHAYFASHWKGTTTDQEYLSSWSSNSILTDQWHTYGMLWTPDGVQSYIDDVPGPKFTGKAVPHESMYLILTLQQWNRFTDTPDGVNMQTDYVRVYQHPNML